MLKLKVFLNSWPKITVILVLLGGVAVFVGELGNSDEATSSTAAGTIVAVVVPSTFSAQAGSGKALFEESCAACHGINASGTAAGPPLVHDIYNPGHHADESFARAARNGVPSHHWPYGDMPPIANIGVAQVRAITTYVRELQIANGITWQPHIM
ncbi:MAG: c-type cytochrome [Alphaproteobacteria bacterium]